MGILEAAFFFFIMRTEIFPADFSSLQAIRDFVAQAALDAGMDDKEAYAVQLAVDEAASNIIEHACCELECSQIEITCNARADGLAIILRDHGRPFDPKKIKAPNLGTDISKRKIGGLGMYMIRKLMDEVCYETSPENGNTLTLFKRKTGAE